MLTFRAEDFAVACGELLSPKPASDHRTRPPTQIPCVGTKSDEARNVPVFVLSGLPITCPVVGLLPQQAAAGMC